MIWHKKAAFFGSNDSIPREDRATQPGAPSLRFFYARVGDPRTPTRPNPHLPTLLHKPNTLPSKTHLLNQSIFCKWQQMNNLQTQPVDSMAVSARRFWPIFARFMPKMPPFHAKIQDFRRPPYLSKKEGIP